MSLVESTRKATQYLPAETVYWATAISCQPAEPLMTVPVLSVNKLPGLVPPSLYKATRTLPDRVLSQFIPIVWTSPLAGNVIGLAATMFAKSVATLVPPIVTVAASTKAT